MILLTTGSYSDKQFVGLIEDDLEGAFRCAMSEWVIFRDDYDQSDGCHGYEGCSLELVLYLKNHRPELWGKIIRFRELNIDSSDGSFHEQNRPCIKEEKI
jgi:hypothetical protein